MEELLRTVMALYTGRIMVRGIDCRFETIAVAAGAVARGRDSPGGEQSSEKTLGCNEQRRAFASAIASAAGLAPRNERVRLTVADTGEGFDRR